MTTTGSLGGRLSWPLRCANAPAETTPSIAITINCRISLIIFQAFSSCKFPRTGGRKRCAVQEAARQVPQNRTAVPAAFPPKSLTVHAQIRTVSNSAAPYRIAHKRGTKEHKRSINYRPSLEGYLLTVTLNVPTLPLLSNVRREIVCSPGPSWPKSTE